MEQVRVLVAEDDAIIALLLAETLEDLGYRICAIAATQDDFIAAARLHAPDLMIVDAGLADGSGIDAVAAILRTQTIAHVFVTGNAAAVRGRMPDAVILQKPFFLPELEAAVAAALVPNTVADCS